MILDAMRHGPIVGFSWLLSLSV